MDFSTFNFINQFAGHSRFLDSIMIGLAKYGVMLMVLPLIYMWFKGNAGAKKAALLSLLSMAIALLINQVIGYIYFRHRPFEFHEVNLLLDKSTDPSFPSDHAAFVFAIASLIWLNDRRIGFFALGIGILVGISRVFVGIHYPGDILGGLLTGLTASLLVWNIRGKLDPITSYLIGIAKRLRLA